MDESGHDRKSAPYEVRGGVALSAGRLWPFVQSVQRLELEAFGCLLSEFKKEFKGSHLLDKNRFAWAAQGPAIPDPQRRKLAKSFLEKGVRKGAPTKPEFTAYGQACISMALGVFQALRDHDACLFAVAIPRTTQKPPGPELEYLRKDQVFLLERYFYFLE